MKKTSYIFIILFAVLFSAVVAIPAVTTEALTAPAQAISGQTLFTELTLPDSSTILFITIQLDDSGKATKADEIPSIMAKLEQADSDIDLSQYSHMYYHEVALGGELLAVKAYNVADSHWIHFSGDPQNPAPEFGGDVPLGKHEVGPFVIEITGFERDKSYSGEDLVTIILNFSNFSDETTSFFWALNYKAFQNGIEIDTGSSYGENNMLRDVRPGATLNEVKLSYVINDVTPVTVEFSDFSNFLSDDLIEITFDVPME